MTNNQKYDESSLSISESSACVPSQPTPDTSFVEHRSPMAAKLKSRRHKKNASTGSKEPQTSSDDQDKTSSTGSDDKNPVKTGLLEVEAGQDPNNSSSLSSSLVSQEDEFLGGDSQVLLFQHCKVKNSNKRCYD